MEKRYHGIDGRIMLGKAFISFMDIETRNRFLELYKERSFFEAIFSYCIDKKQFDITLNGETYYLTVTKPQEPRDIKWKNLDYNVFN